MKNIIKLFLIGLITVGTFQFADAKEPTTSGKPDKGDRDDFLELRVDCAQATESTDMEINNVRARLWTGGDIWWDRRNGRYVVPKPPVGSGIEEVSSLFAGGVWLGGLDPNGNLKLAASTYPSNSNSDYYPGPLDEGTGQIAATECLQWDEFFRVDGDNIRRAVRAFDSAMANETDFTEDSVSADIRFWPGQGNIFFEEEFEFPLPFTSAGLGNFWDESADGIYNPELGDFPIIDIRGCEPATRAEALELVPDEMIFWIYNDAGNDHESTRGDIINMEVQVQAFAYATNDEINDMTFMRHKLINRAKEDIREMYFAMWVDPDLGCFEDDYVGCDVSRSLAYTYNADALDGSGNTTDCGDVNTYGENIPIIGTDYFRGPIAPKVICDNPSDLGCEQRIVSVADVFNPDSLVVGDTIFIRDPDLLLGEVANFGFELGMSSFIAYNNPTVGNPEPQTGDPQVASEYYTYLQGLWLDGTPLTVGGTGFNPGSLDVTSFQFPDPPSDPNGWSTCSEELAPGDRRTVQASGPFLLAPNAVNELIIGAVWVPDLDYPCPDITRLLTADDIAQNLFDSCFDITDGPDAPTVSIIELDRELILVLNNDSESNNFGLQYQEIDVQAPANVPAQDKIYKFEGYQIYQLAEANVTPQELDNIDRARLVAQADIRNGITELYNWTAATDPNAIVTGNPDPVWTPTRVVSGQDDGIINTFRLQSDAFASGDTRFINHQQYFYLAVAYAHNEFALFNPAEWRTTQSTPYLEGRGNIATYTGVPRPIVYENLNAQYGDGVSITRLRGTGTGGENLRLTDDMHDLILSGEFSDENGNNRAIRYESGAGPIDIKIYDPLSVQNGTFQLEIVGTHNNASVCSIEDGARWILTEVETGRVFESDQGIDFINEQLIPEFGISINVLQADNVGEGGDDNGAVASTVEYDSDDAIQWFTAIQDGLPASAFSANQRSVFDFVLTETSDVDRPAFNTDPESDFTNLGSGFWYPFMLTSGASKPNNIDYLTPAWDVQNSQSAIRPPGSNIIRFLNNVDVVMTNDKSKWSRCIVVESESGNGGIYTNAKQEKFDLRNLPSVNQDGVVSTGDAGSVNSSNYIEDFANRGDLPADLGEVGYSWFPGYAIDVETGRRLNIFFGENSAFDEEYSRTQSQIGFDTIANRPIYGPDSLDYTNGYDMLYNPTNDLLSSFNFNGGPGVPFARSAFVGGQHIIYVSRDEYDGCADLGNLFNTEPIPFFAKQKLTASINWTSMSYVAPGESILSYEEGVVPSDVSFQLRVDKPYNLETELDLDNRDGSRCIVADGEVGGFPLYEFEIDGRASEALADEDFDSALANINVVPNPYYAFSVYERSQFDKIIKITNVPDRAEVSIFSLDGKFIRGFSRAETPSRRSGSNVGVQFTQTNPSIEWNLENSAGIPVSSGVYLIHISAPRLDANGNETGVVDQRTIKWFGVNRQFDPSGL